MNGYSYDADGNQTSDIFGHSLAFDANGMLTSVNGGAETYTYDAQGNRVQVAGSATTDYVYFGGVPIATVSAGSWTDLIYAGGGLLAEVAGSQSATPTYRLMDNLGTLGGSLSGSGSLGNTVNYTPYGELFSGSTSDSFGFTGLPWDSTTALWHADARQFSPQQSRWQSPDLYEGSYNWGDPQSLNRYAYVNGRPTWAIDPSGLDGGAGSGAGKAAGPCGLAAGSSGGDVIADAFCARYLWDFFDSLFGGPSFHGSLKPRPVAGPWDDKFGVPYPGLGNGITQAIGLPTGSQCEFGACGGGSSNVFGGASAVLGHYPFNPNYILPAMSFFYWFDDQHQQAHGPAWHKFRWCGPGGAGAPINAHDSNCMMHDYCYYRHGLSWFSNFDFAGEMPGPRGAIQQCNQQLCDAEAQIGGWTADQIIGYFTIAPDNGRGCR